MKEGDIAMSAKDEYCFRVLRKYGLLVNFDGDPRTTNVPEPVDEGDETLSHWTRRVLGPDVKNLVIYRPEKLDGKHKIFRLQNLVDAAHLQQVLRSQSKVRNALAKERKDTAVEKTQRLYTNISTDTIKDFLDEMGDELEPSVRDFFDRMINASENELDTEVLIKDVMTRYNEVARKFRKMNRTEVTLEQTITNGDLL
jgi:archaellum component FlaC